MDTYNKENNVTINIASDFTSRVRIYAPSIGFDKVYLITDIVGEVMIPGSIIQTTNATIDNTTIYISSEKDISVNILICSSWSVDGILALPVNSLSTSYIVPSAAPFSVYPSEFLIAATKNATKVSIQFSKDLAENGQIALTLNEYETYQFKHACDLSGTYIESTAPVALFAGVSYTVIPTHSGLYGSLLFEQIPPVDSTRQRWIVPPLQGRRDFVVKMIALKNQTRIQLKNSTGVHVFVLDSQSQLEVFNANDPVLISSTKPISVVQYSINYDIDSKGSEFMTMIPSISSYLNKYVFFIPTVVESYDNYLCVIAPTSDPSRVLVDGSPLSNVKDKYVITTDIGKFTIWTVSITTGRHSVAAPTKIGFGAFLYGYEGPFQYPTYPYFKYFKSYGYPLGMQL